jgi:hypothetical protein
VKPEPEVAATVAQRGPTTSVHGGVPARVAYPTDEVLEVQSKALRASTWESASDVVHPIGSNLMGPREIARVTGLPFCIFSLKQARDSLGVPDRRDQKLIRFDRDECMAWAKRWSQEAKNQSIEAKTGPAHRYRSLQHARASLPA